MANPLSASKLVQLLRAEGLTVHEVRDWRTHNRNHKGAWGPVNGVMIHHTVTSGTAATVDLCYDGYTGLPGPLCHGVIDKKGEVWLVGNGRANHAGLGDDDVLRAVIAETALPADNEANTDGNRYFYGFECINLGDGKDPWPAAQLEAIEKVSAAICRYHGWTERSVIGHLEWQPGKVDPRGFTMASMRGRIKDRLAGGGREEWEMADFKTELSNFLKDDASRKLLVNAIFRTDGAVSTPIEGDTANPHWEVQSYLLGLYRRSLNTDAQVTTVRAKLDELVVGGVDLDALAAKVADLLAARLAE